MTRQPLRVEWLNDTAYNTYSQFGEDGVLDAIFSVIGAANQWCLECGAADGLFFSNTRRLIEQDWRAVLIEADPAAFGRLVANCDGFGERVACVNARIDDRCRLESVLHRVGAPVDIDLVVIDVDGQDYHLFNSLLNYRPRVVVVEYQPGAACTDFIPANGGEGQAGLGAMRRLAMGRLYTEVFRSVTNLILVRQPLDQLLSGDRAAMLEKLQASLQTPEGVAA